MRIRFVAASTSQLGSLLRTAREKANMTLEQAAASVISPEDLQRIENGEIFEIPAVVLIALASNLAIDADSVLLADANDRANRKG